MTALTVAMQSIKDEDSDTISLTSTQESEVDYEKSYVVDRILAEEVDDEGEKLYLIRWEDYDILASTWEPAENIEGQATLDEWDAEKMRIDRGLSEPFDLTGFEDQKRKVDEGKAIRRKRRRAKRKRLGIAVSPSESEKEPSALPVDSSESSDGNEESDDDSDDAVPLARRQQLSKPRNDDRVPTDDEELQDILPKKARQGQRRRHNINREDVEDTSDDSLIEEVQKGIMKSWKVARAARKNARKSATIGRAQILSLENRTDMCGV
jgi:hypothetical protein